MQTQAIREGRAVGPHTVFKGLGDLSKISETRELTPGRSLSRFRLIPQYRFSSMLKQVQESLESESEQERYNMLLENNEYYLNQKGYLVNFGSQMTNRWVKEMVKAGQCRVVWNILVSARSEEPIISGTIVSGIVAKKLGIISHLFSIFKAVLKGN